MRLSFISMLCVLAFGGLSACGDTVGEQALIGAGVGAGTAVVLNGSVGTGLLVGAAGNVAYCQTTNRC